MGTAEIEKQELVIYSHIITYGNAATPELTEQMRDEIETMWNEPKAVIRIKNESFIVRFKTTAQYVPTIKDIDIYQNTDPRNNYFRIEEFVIGNISFVDGLGCNSGYFKLENLYKGSTTAAHEYGHTLGLDHPTDIDLRGKGIPGIMYPRGTLVDAPYQYDPNIPAGQTGGTMHPMYRKVQTSDIELLKLHRLTYRAGKAILGDFTNFWHPEQKESFS
ncbi:MAG: peptidase M10 [Bacteroidetes bacterium]|nr:peptidase M10 [Bacteroidota bacterium]